MVIETAFDGACAFGKRDGPVQTETAALLFLNHIGIVEAAQAKYQYDTQEQREDTYSPQKYAPPFQFSLGKDAGEGYRDLRQGVPVCVPVDSGTGIVLAFFDGNGNAAPVECIGYGNLTRREGGVTEYTAPAALV